MSVLNFFCGLLEALLLAIGVLSRRSDEIGEFDSYVSTLSYTSVRPSPSSSTVLHAFNYFVSRIQVSAECPISVRLRLGAHFVMGADSYVTIDLGNLSFFPPFLHLFFCLSKPEIKFAKWC